MCVCVRAAEDKGTESEIVGEEGRRGWGGGGWMGLENALMDFVVRFTHFRLGSLCDSVPAGFYMPLP